jgi:5'(3')-deoxyribonucleotidase
MANLALDLDGVVADFPGKLLEIYNSRHEPALTLDDLDQYDLRTLPEGIGDNLIGIFNEPGFFLSLNVYPKAIETVYRLLGKGYTIEVCTAPPHTRNPLAVVEKLDWVAKTIPELDGHVTVTSNKFYMATNMLIDDHIDNIVAWCEAHPDGIGFLVNLHWNQNVTELPLNAVRGKLSQVPDFLDQFFCKERGEFAYRLSELTVWKTNND